MSKLALITGANKGIGLETARQLGRQGFHVLVGARDAKAGESAVAKLRQEGITADALTIDVTAPASIAAAAASVNRVVTIDFMMISLRFGLIGHLPRRGR